MRAPFLTVVMSILYFAITSTNQVNAQLPIYNSDFVLARSVRMKGELGDSLRIMGIVDRTYDIRGVKVIEYYAMNTAEFLGFAGDTTQFTLKDLPYLSRTPMMRRLVKQFGPANAHDIRQGKFINGILQKDILTMHGWPKKRKRENGVEMWLYDEVLLEFQNNTLTNAIESGS